MTDAWICQYDRAMAIIKVGALRMASFTHIDHLVESRPFVIKQKKNMVGIKSSFQSDGEINRTEINVNTILSKTCASMEQKFSRTP